MVGGVIAAAFAAMFLIQRRSPSLPCPSDASAGCHPCGHFCWNPSPGASSLSSAKETAAFVVPCAWSHEFSTARHKKCIIDPTAPVSDKRNRLVRKEPFSLHGDRIIIIVATRKVVCRYE